MSALSTFAGKLVFSDAIRGYFIRRVRRKRGEVNLPFQLEYRNIYVLPTTFGGAFALMLVGMALGGLNFNNNMALLLVFLLGSITQMTTLLSYRTLVGLRVEGIRAEPVFAGEHARFLVYLGNPDDRDRLTVQAALAGEPLQDCIDLPGGSTRPLTLTVPTRRRGWLELPDFRLETRYPMGLFRAWCWFFPRARCLVYPAPAKSPPPLPRSGRGEQGQAEKGDGEQVHGLRNYREGDPLRRVAWRTSARHDELYTREMETPRDLSCVLDWHLLGGLDHELRISVLAAWVLQADHRGLRYRLELPGASSGPGAGADHRADCLEMLALFDP